MTTTKEDKAKYIVYGIVIGFTLSFFFWFKYIGG